MKAIVAENAEPASGQLRPFFGYFGGKWRDALKHYPSPKFDTIIEPFAGSAGYSLRYYTKKVVLCEADPILAGVWTYLIKVKPSEILAIGDLRSDQSVDSLKVCQEAKWLVGFWLNRGVASPRKKPSKWMREGVRPGSFWGDRVRQTIAKQVNSIRHWKIHQCDYTECPVSIPATWFIDPPYEVAGQYYRHGSDKIDYVALAAWCRSRPGEVVVCENEGARWLPFKSLANVKTTRANSRSREVLWFRSTTVEPANNGHQLNGHNPNDFTSKSDVKVKIQTKDSGRSLYGVRRREVDSSRNWKSP